MGEYEEGKKKVDKAYEEYRKEFYTPAPRIGDGKRATHNRVMEHKTEAVAEALRDFKAVAPTSEQAMINEAIDKHANEARDFGKRADHYESK